MRTLQWIAFSLPHLCNFYVVTCEDIFISAKLNATRSSGVEKQDNNFCHHNWFNHRSKFNRTTRRTKTFLYTNYNWWECLRNQQIVIVFRRSCRGAEELFKGQSPGGFCGFATVSKQHCCTLVQKFKEYFFPKDSSSQQVSHPFELSWCVHEFISIHKLSNMHR